MSAPHSISPSALVKAAYGRLKCLSAIDTGNFGKVGSNSAAFSLKLTANNNMVDLLMKAASGAPPSPYMKGSNTLSADVVITDCKCCNVVKIHFDIAAGVAMPPWLLTTGNDNSYIAEIKFGSARAMAASPKGHDSATGFLTLICSEPVRIPIAVTLSWTDYETVDHLVFGAVKLFASVSCLDPQ